jgi:hypothetical protein
MMISLTHRHRRLDLLDPRASSTTLCKVAAVAPPRHLPTMIAALLTGATSISRRKPNSRSQTSEMPAKAALNRSEYPHLWEAASTRKQVEPGASFDYGLDLLMRGIRAR